MNGVTRQRLEYGLRGLYQVEISLSNQRQRVLFELRRDNTPRKPTKIARTLGLKPPTVRNILSSLYKQGIIEQTPKNKYSIIK